MVLLGESVDVPAMIRLLELCVTVQLCLSIPSGERVLSAVVRSFISVLQGSMT